MDSEIKYFTNDVGTIRCTDDNYIEPYIESPFIKNPAAINKDRAAFIKSKSDVENNKKKSYKDPSILILLVVAGIIIYKLRA